MLSIGEDSKRFEYKRLFAKNVLFAAGQWIVQLMVGLFMVGYVVSRLGEEQWGLVVLGLSISTYLSLIQAGASVGISTRLNESYTRGDKATFRSYYTFAIFLCAVLSLIVVTATTTIVILFWPEVGIPERYNQEGKIVLLALTASTVSTALSLPLIGCLQAIHRLDVSSKIQAWSVIVRAAGTLASFELVAPSASAYAIVFLATNVLALLWLYWWVRANMPEARIATQGLAKSQLIDLIAINGATFFNTVSYVIFMQGPVLLYRENLGFVGLYGIGLQINNLVRGVFFSPFSALTSVMVSLNSAGKRDDVRTWFVVTTKVYVAAATMIWLWMVVLGPAVLHLWIQSGINGEMLNEALPYLIGITALGIISLPSSAVEIALGRLRFTAFIGVGLALMFLITLITFVPQGTENLFVSASASVVFFYGLWEVAKIVRVGKELQYQLFNGTLTLLFRPSLPAILVSLPLIVIQKAYQPSNAIELALLTIFAGTLFVILFFMAGLDTSERKQSCPIMKEFLGRSWKGVD